MNVQLSARRNVVIVRAGAASLHPQWLSRDRTWDLIVSLYEPCAHAHESDDVRVVYEKGGKWDGIYKLLNQDGLWDRYDLFWLPDDDIEATSNQIDRIFATMNEFALDIAQPALTHDSFVTHFLFHACSGFAIRYSNSIEIMAPCLRKSILQHVYTDFRDTLSGFGLDDIWCRLSLNPIRRSAIIDSIAVRHTRPIGHSLRRNMSRMGLSAKEEEQRMRARYGLGIRASPMAYFAIDLRGRTVSGKRRMGLMMAWSYVSDILHFRYKMDFANQIIRLLRRQFFRPIDLTPLRRLGDN